MVQYTPYLAQAGQMIGQGIMNRGAQQLKQHQNALVGKAMSGDTQSLQALMTANPTLGMQVSQHVQKSKDKKAQDALNKSTQDRSLEKAMQTSMENLTTQMAGLPYEEAKELFQREAPRLGEMFPEIGKIVGGGDLDYSEEDHGKIVKQFGTESGLTNIQKGLGPDGKIAILGYNKETNQMEVIEGGKPVPSKGMRITMADGSVVETGVPVGGGLTKSNKTQVGKDLLAATDALLKVNDIAKGFKKEYHQFATRFKIKGKGLISSLGGEISPEDEKEVADYADYRANAGRLLAETLSELSGAAVTPSEAKRAETYIPKVGSGLFDGDNPIDMQAKIKNFQKFQMRAVARLNFIRTKGMEIGDIPLDKMDSIIERRGEAIEKELTDNGMPQEQAENMARQQLSKEFGLVR